MFATPETSPANGAGSVADRSSKRRGNGSEAVTRAGKLRLLTLDDLDKRTAAARRAVELRDKLRSERGGVEGLGALKAAMLDSVAVLTAAIEHLASLWLQGQAVDATELATLLNARRREADMIGINPEPRDVTPDARAYAAELVSRRAAAATTARQVAEDVPSGIGAPSAVPAAPDGPADATDEGG